MEKKEVNKMSIVDKAVKDFADFLAHLNELALNQAVDLLQGEEND